MERLASRLPSPNFTSSVVAMDCATAISFDPVSTQTSAITNIVLWTLPSQAPNHFIVSKHTSAIHIRMSSTTTFLAVIHLVYTFATTIIHVGTRIIHIPTLISGPRFFVVDIVIVMRPNGKHQTSCTCRKSGSASGQPAKGRRRAR